MLLLDQWGASHPAGLSFLAENERRAELLGAILHAFDPDCGVMVLPRWDAFPYDGVYPSREVLGRRSSVLRRLSERARPPLVIATAASALQRVPPPSAWRSAGCTLMSGTRLPQGEIEAFCERSGYVTTARVDGPGEVKFSGPVIDIFPAGALGPVRIERDGDVAVSMQSFDPETQRTSGEIASLTLDPASEFSVTGLQAEEATPPRESLFEYLAEAPVIADATVPGRGEAWLAQIAEAYALRRSVPRGPAAETQVLASPPDELYLDLSTWRRLLARPSVAILPVRADSSISPVPKFAIERAPVTAFRRFVSQQIEAGQRILLTGATEVDLRSLERRCGMATTRRQRWEEVRNSRIGSISSLLVDLDGGFVAQQHRITVLAASDLLGSRADRQRVFGARPSTIDDEFVRIEPGNAVVHLERGLGILRGLEPIDLATAPGRELMRIAFADKTSVLLPVEELAIVWKYASSPDRLSLNSADGSSWAKRRKSLHDQIVAVAAKVADEVSRRERAGAARLVPPAADYERFADRFPFTPTPDQADAIDAVLEDLACGRRMDRLLCGDVGFGKTEVALRAAAATVLSGKQAVVVAPTTLLARQHAITFRRRFTPLGIDVGHLSRTSPAAERRRVAAGLASGELRLTVGTHALAGKRIAFSDLALVVVDEEHRFGARQKQSLRELSHGAHLLTMTATPIPRTFAAALVGLREVSVLAEPPAHRLPIRTAVTSLNAGIVEAALRFERKRGGQSFFVCPRIEDLAPMRELLCTALPDLQLLTLHGKMPAAEIDETMVRFADGRGDVLLTTDIIESGLDLPRVNSILVWRADRFGTAQLHQLRGRVGRGNARGFAYFLTDPDAPPAEAAKKRLAAVQESAAPGAGLALSARDADLRGIGDLFGEEQAGCVALVGPELYRYLLQQAVAARRGEDFSWIDMVDLHIEGSFGIPTDSVPEPAIRLEIYDRVAKARTQAAIDALADEFEDRFGAPAAPTQALFERARIQISARALGICRIDAGPAAIALSFRSGLRKCFKTIPGTRREGDRLIRPRESDVAQGARILTETLNFIELVEQAQSE